MAGRRTNLASLLEGENLEESTEPTHQHAPSSAYLKQLAHNPFNPREELTDVEETAASLNEKGQIQPIAVVTRRAFLEAHPGQDDQLADALYVVIDGNRRLAAARLAGLDSLRIDVNDRLAESAADMLESALIANVHRVDVPPLDQARAIQGLVQVHGSQERVAKRLGKSGAWVSQRLALLELPEDLQGKVESGELTVKDGRRIGRLPEAKQRPEAEKAINRVKAPRKASRAAAPAPEEEPNLNPVKTLTKLPEQPAPPDHSAVAIAIQEVVRLTADVDGLADALVKHLPPEVLEALTHKLVDRLN